LRNGREESIDILGCNHHGERPWSIDHDTAVNAESEFDGGHKNEALVCDVHAADVGVWDGPAALCQCVCVCVRVCVEENEGKLFVL
jgi:hypothetical protein